MKAREGLLAALVVVARALCPVRAGAEPAGDAPAVTPAATPAGDTPAVTPAATPSATPAASSDAPAGISVYRLYNPYVDGGDHHYTMDADEYEALEVLGWRQEGVGWRSGGSVKVYRQYNRYATTGTHNYTTSKAENDALVRLGWRAEGVGWYAVRAK